MSLSIAYSSDEDDNITSHNQDVFGLASLPSAKKARVEETPSVPMDAAPHVLAEVSIPLFSISTCSYNTTGPFEYDFSGDSAE